ncbi:MAG: hypothetical protein AB7P40_31685 [Chloroflexota bacterium]
MRVNSDSYHCRRVGAHDDGAEDIAGIEQMGEANASLVDNLSEEQFRQRPAKGIV